MLNIEHRISNVEVGLIFNSKFDIQNSEFDILFFFANPGRLHWLPFLGSKFSK